MKLFNLIRDLALKSGYCGGQFATSGCECLVDLAFQNTVALSCRNLCILDCLIQRSDSRRKILRVGSVNCLQVINRLLKSSDCLLGSGYSAFESSQQGIGGGNFALKLCLVGGICILKRLLGLSKSGIESGNLCGEIGIALSHSRVKRFNRLVKRSLGRCYYVDVSADHAGVAVRFGCAGARLKNGAASVVTNVVVVESAVEMLAYRSHTTAVTSVVTVYVYVSQCITGRGAALGTGGRRLAGNCAKLMGNVIRVVVIVSRRTDGIRVLGIVTYKLVHTLQEPEVARAVVGAIPRSVQQEILSVKLDDVPHMVDVFCRSEYYVTLYANGIQKAHNAERIALTYRPSVNQRAVSGEAVICRSVVGYVLANVVVNCRNLFDVGLAREVKSIQNRVNCGIYQLLLGGSEVVFRMIRNGVIVSAFLGILGGRRAITLDGKGTITVKQFLGIVEPLGKRVLGNKRIGLEVEGLSCGASLLQGFCKCIHKLISVGQIYLFIRGRNRAEVAHVKHVVCIYRITLVVDRLVGGKGNGSGKIYLIGLFHKGQGRKGAGGIAFGHTVAVCHEGVLSCRLIVVDRNLISGGKASLYHRYQLKGVRVVLDTVLHTPDTGIAVDTNGNVQIIVVLLGLNGQIFLNRAVVGAHRLGNRCCLRQSDFDGLIKFSVTGRYRVKFHTNGKVRGGDTITAHRLVQAVAINDNLIQRTAVIAAVSIVVSVEAGIDMHTRRILIGKCVVRAVVRPGLEIIHDRSVIGVGIGSIGAGKRKLHVVRESANVIDPALERISNRKLLCLTLIDGSY